MKRLLIAAIALSALSACAHPETLQYDYSRSYSETFSMQADLSRESVNMELYELSGVEGMLIRAAVETETTNSEDTSTSSLQVGM
ncbi:MAG: hypothetical protein VX899_15345 [Myxococcota bacterium]|nr:hypothetical protein [Myxococcota bacterium]